MKVPTIGLDSMRDFDEIIDVRSPAEFADDHLPGARNFPVLDDAERAEVGTLYRQDSPFAARRFGAALVARNIARHLQESFLDRPRSWRPLVYCWRGGNRSAAMVTILRAIGWQACQLEGGYKTYRRQVIDELEALPGCLFFRILCGPTGSGKTCILQALAARGEQVLDLEGLACHKGSVLGVLPETPQPSQKAFESALAAQLRTFDPARPVYAEAESRKIGRLRITDALLTSLRAGQCIEISAPLACRVDALLADYAHFLQSPALLKEQLEGLRSLHGKEILAEWHRLIDAGEWPTLVSRLLDEHYDPLYRRSQESHYGREVPATSLIATGFSGAALSSLCAAIVDNSSPMGSASCP